jgi:fucose permease
MAFAYIGFLVMPPLFGVIAEKISIMLLPLFLSILLVAMVLMHEIVVKKTKKD